MASKKTTLPKPKGINPQGSIVQLDLDDFDDLFDEDFGLPKKNSPYTDFKSGLKSGFLDKFKTTTVLKNFLRHAAPDGFNRLFGVYDDLVTSAKDIKDSVERTNAADLDYLGRKAKSYLPYLEKHIPNTLYKSMDEGLSRKLEQYNYEMEAGRDQIAIRKRAQQAADENEIKAALDQNTLVSKENFQRSEQGIIKRAAMEKAERNIRDKISAGRFDFTSRAMSMAVDSLTRISAYHEQVSYGMQRKSLELQFRSYLGIRDLVRLTEANMELQDRAFQALVRNTGIPEHKKAGMGSGLLGFGDGRGNASFAKALAGAAFSTLPGFMGNWGGQVEDRVKKSLSGRLADIVSAARMGEGAGSFWDQRYNLAGMMAGEFGSDVINDHIAPWLGSKLRPGATRLAQRFGGRHNQLNYTLDNIPAFLQEFVNNSQNQYGWKGTVRDMIAPFIPQFSLKDRLDNGTYQTIDQQTAFNQLTQRSITEVIPGLLSRAVQELRMIRTGRNDVEREVFDITTGKFTVEKTAQDNVMHRVIPKTAIRNTSGMINDALNNLDQEGQLSPAARKALSERLLRDASTNRRFDPNAYIRAGGYADGLSPDVTNELSQFFRGKFQFDDKGKMTDTAANHQLRDEWSRAFLDIRSVSRDPIKEIHRLVNAGHTESLRMLGIIVTEQGQDKINYNRVWEILRSGVSDNNPYAGGPMPDPEQTGTPGDKGFVGPAYPGAAKAGALNAMVRFRRKYAPEEQRARDEWNKFANNMRGRYGSAADQIREAGGFGDWTNSMYGRYSPKVSGMATDVVERAKAFAERHKPGAVDSMMSRAKALAGNFFPNGLSAGGVLDAAMGYGKSAYSQAMSQMPGMNDAAGSYVQEGMNKIMDLYSKFDPKVPLIKGTDFIQGKLIDLNTKKVITKPSDITGAVINMAGMTVLTAQEAANGLFDITGQMVIKTLTNNGDISNAVSKNTGGMGAAANDAENPNEEKDLEEQDWCIDGDPDPIITSRGLKNGSYFDSVTGDVVTKLNEVKGDILDKFGNIVATAKELAVGLISRKTGKRWRLKKGPKAILNIMGKLGKFGNMTAHQAAWGMIKFGAKAALGIASKAFNFVVETQNAYLPDSDDPVFERRKCHNGEYFDEKGNVIENFADVYGQIYDAKGEPILPLEQFKDLINYDGTKHILAKNKKLIRRTLNRGIRALRKKYVNMSKRYWKWLGRTSAKLAPKVGRKLLGGFASAGGAIMNRLVERVPYEDFETTDQVLLGQILETLRGTQEQQVREGSWQDQAAKKAEAAERESLFGSLGGRKGEGDQEKAQNIFMRGLTKGLQSVFSKITGKDADEDSGIMDLILGGGKKGGGKGRLGGMLARAAPYAAAGAATAVGTAITAKKFNDQGFDGKESGLLTALSATAPGKLMTDWIIAPTMLKFKNVDKLTKPFILLRMAQYGITDLDQQSKIFTLEQEFEKSATRGERSDISMEAVGAKRVFEILDIKPDDKARIKAMADWLQLRFRPIFNAYLNALHSVDKDNINVTEMDDKLPNELKGAVLEKVKFPMLGDTPYQYRMSPFDPEGKLEDTTADITERFEKYTKMFAGVKALALANKNKVARDKAMAGEAASTVQDAAKKAVDTAVKGSPLSMVAPGVPSPLAPVDPKSKMQLKTALGGTAVITGVGKLGSSLTGLQAIRMRAYGLQTMAYSDVQALLSLEARFVEGLKISNGEANYTGDTEDLIQTTAPLFGKDPSDGSKDRVGYVNWLLYRFAPAFRAYMLASSQFAPSANLNGLESKLKPGDKVTVANAVLGAADGGNSVWKQASIFEIKGDPEDLKKLAEADLEHLKQEAEKDIAASPTQSAGSQAAGKAAADAGGSFADKAVSSIKNAWEKTKDTAATAWQNTKNAVSAGVDNVMDMKDAATYRMGLAGEVKATGNTYGSLAQGNGGQWEQIPMPKQNKSAAAARETLSVVAQMVGVPVELLMIFCAIESSFDWNARAGTSNASGWFQFINSTWDGMIKKYSAKYGLPADTPQRSLRMDPRINALMGAEFVKENFTILQNALGRAPTDVDLYVAHFMGPYGAKKFLMKDQNSIGAAVFPKEAAANRTIFYKNKGTGPARTLGEIYQTFESLVARFRKMAGGTGSDVKMPQQPGEEKSSQELAEEQSKQAAKSGSAAISAWDVDTSDNASDAAVARSEAYLANQGKPQVPVLPGITPMSTAPVPAGTTSPDGTQTGATPSADSGVSVAAAGTNARVEAAQQQNTIRQHEIRQSQQVQQKAIDVQGEQLAILIQIRDHLAILVAAAQSKGSIEQQQVQTGSAGGGNNMTSTQRTSRPALDRPSPLKLQ
ncbi:tail fiber protein [Pseudomonas phage PhiPA3]|uniref:Tail fibre protein n=1 Tax=Pseudomonas phage PhiPA3 TaxID=998086 RepID=F8SJ56_BPPA3|nr:tail fiber protein [Pseudomonas phage PhiPA3]AEH03636.1 tail fibre protein [Pseudomonas phage PhiPA3]